MSKFGSVVSGGAADISDSALSSRPSMLLGRRCAGGGRGVCETEDAELLCRGYKVGGWYTGFGGGLYRELELELAIELGG